MEDPAKCTILITNEIRRTYKFLCVLATGTPIVSSDWLKDSVSAGRFLDWEDYMLLDTAGEAKFGFKLKKSLERAKEKRLLDGYTVVLTPNVAPPSKQELKGKILDRLHYILTFILRIKKIYSIQKRKSARLVNEIISSQIW